MYGCIKALFVMPTMIARTKLYANVKWASNVRNYSMGMIIMIMMMTILAMIMPMIMITIRVTRISLLLIRKGLVRFHL